MKKITLWWKCFEGTIVDHYEFHVNEARSYMIRFPRIWALVVMWDRFLWGPFVCVCVGPDWDSAVDAENGSEDVWCNRCGLSHHAQF